MSSWIYKITTVCIFETGFLDLTIGLAFLLLVFLLLFDVLLFLSCEIPVKASLAAS